MEQHVCISRRGGRWLGFFFFFFLMSDGHICCAHVMHCCNLATPGFTCVTETRGAFGNPAS